MTGDAVSKQDIMALLEAANWAPTHGKTEPWRFVVLGQQGMQAMQDVTEEVYKLKLAAVPERLQVSSTKSKQQLTVELYFEDDLRIYGVLMQSNALLKWPRQQYHSIRWLRF
jgi:nitroreductase